jgi:uncharacterized MnhB-related membrane protein
LLLQSGCHCFQRDLLACLPRRKLAGTSTMLRARDSRVTEAIVGAVVMVLKLVGVT